MYFDTHAHYYDRAFDPDREEVLSAAYEAGVELIVNAACDSGSARACIELAEKHSYIYAAVGWHPHEAKSFQAESPEFLEELCKNPKVVAIGEIGLDYYYDLSERELQRNAFARQLELARVSALPVIVHNREAHADCLEMVKHFHEVSGVFHCFAGSVEMAEELLGLGWYLGFNGAVTFKNAKRAPEVVAMCPLDRLLIETDCPYLTPEPRRGRRNDSSYLPLIVERIAEIKGIAPREVALATLENGKRLFDRIH